MRADLPNFQVEFRHYSENRQGGISSIIEAPGQLVQGVIYEVPEEELTDLDILESVPEGLYRRDTFLVLGKDGQWHQADLYRVSDSTGPYRPSKEYLDDMIDSQPNTPRNWWPCDGRLIATTVTTPRRIILRHGDRPDRFSNQLWLARTPVRPVRSSVPLQF
ncbi:MAG: gamma-glutamylcyclotransferase, partial [Anaerolineae bacterium]|jgi:gamma-glutamylcyclotransferase (GGCT)/AIG2-like uncharacterized protein YtfP